MTRIILFTIVFAFLSSCEPSDTTPYYSFTSSDYEFILEEYQDTDRIFIFRNAQQDEVKMQPQYYTLEKRYDGGIGFGQSVHTEAHYYDDIWMELKILDMEVLEDESCSRVAIHIFKTLGNRLSVDLGMPAFAFRGCIGQGFEEFSPFQGLIEMQLNNNTYSKVRVVEPSESFMFYENSKVNKVYFDMDHGIIGFDDTVNNKEFRLVNN